MSTGDDVSLSDWVTVEAAQQSSSVSAAPSRQHLASSTSALLHSKGARRSSASRPQQATGHIVTPKASPKMWIAGILALSLVWCFVSLLAVSRLEKRLPSEMQDQLEFHTAFSGLWPKAQGAAAEASLSHKHRQRVGTAGRPDEREDSDDSMGEDSASAAGEDFVYRQEPPALAHSQDEDEGGASWSLLPALSTLKHALAAEQSQHGLTRGLKSVQRGLDIVEAERRTQR